LFDNLHLLLCLVLLSASHPNHGKFHLFLFFPLERESKITLDVWLFFKKNTGWLQQLSPSTYIYDVFKSLRTYSLICFLALTSNLVGNLIWTYSWQKETIEFASDEDDSDTDSDSGSNKSSKGAVNLLEEELHLEEITYSSSFHFSIHLLDKTGFCNTAVNPIGQDRIPLDNPPEMMNVLS